MTRLFKLVGVALLGALASSPSSANTYNINAELQLTQRNAYRLRGQQELAQNKQTSQLKLGATPSANSHVTLIARNSYDHYYDQARFNASDVAEHRAESSLREGYADLYFGNYSLRLGKQQVTWGESDYFRTLDVINALDLRDFLLPYVDDFQAARNTLNMANLIHQGEQWESQLLYIPDFQKDQLAANSADFASPQLAALKQQVTAVQVQQPQADIDDAAWGLRSKGTFDWGELGVYGYSGWSSEAQLALSGSTLQMNYQRRQFVGVSLSRPSGAWVVRSDLAYRLKERLTAQLSSGLAYTQHDVAEWLVGADYSDGPFNLSLQLHHRQILQHKPQVLEDRHSNSFSIYIACDYMGDRLQLSNLLLGELDDYNALNETRLSYRFTDQLSADIGFDWFTGKGDKLYGQFKNQSRLFSSLQYFF